MENANFIHQFLTLFDEAAIEPLSTFLLGLTQSGWIVLVSILTGALVSGFLIGRARVYHTTVFQNRGEAIVSRALSRNFGYPDYHLMNHITLMMDDGTTQIDHLLISRFGVFVIETKHYKGWIFGSASQSNWTQVLYRAKFRFQNPIRQNARHVRAVQDLLHFLPDDAIKSVVVFSGDAEFKTEVPRGVFSASGLVNYVNKQVDEIISAEQMQQCVGQLEIARLAISGETDLEHVQSLERRHGGRSARSARGKWGRTVNS